MKKRIVTFIFAVVFLTAAFRAPFVAAVSPLSPDADASLTLIYQKDGLRFEGINVSVYRVAQAFSNGTFSLVAPFSSYPVNIHDVMKQEQWKNIASTLNAYIVANKLSPDRVGSTNESGIAVFEGLNTGLYFVREVAFEDEGATYIFNQFMVYVPTPLPDGSYNYHVEAVPKCISYPKDDPGDGPSVDPDPEKRTEYRVTKLWQDTEDQTNRPEGVAVEIYKNGIIYATQILNAENNWSYLWCDDADKYNQWTVIESSVPDGYKATVQQNGNSFSIINTYISEEDPKLDEPESPPTGDRFLPTSLIYIMAFCGTVLILLGARSRRHD